jgi:hypothetical protein
MSALLDKIKEMEREMLVQAMVKMSEIKSIKFTEEDEVYVGVVDRHFETIEVKIKEVYWDSCIKIRVYDDGWGDINLYDVYRDDVTYIYDLILDYNV